MRKWKELKVLLLSFLLVMILGMTASAENAQKVVDYADLLTTEEEETLQEQLSEIAETYQCDIAVVTVESCEGKDIQTYTDDYYYENGYGYGEDIDGIMLLVSMEERQFQLATRGEAIRIFTDYGLEEIDLSITGYLSDADYDMAFWRFGYMADNFMREYRETGTAFDTNKLYEEELDLFSCLLIGAAAGLVVALVVVIVLFAQLKSVGVERYAGEYVKQGSFHLSRSRDIYLYHTVTKRRKPKEDNDSGGGSSTHSTSDGGSAGGRTGSF